VALLCLYDAMAMVGDASTRRSGDVFCGVPLNFVSILLRYWGLRDSYFLLSIELYDD
jgi:hypothetical protein